MYTFIAAAGLKHRAARGGQSVARVLEAAGRRVVRQLPEFSAPLVIATAEVAQIEGGWVTIRPERETTPPLLSTFDDGSHTLLVFGQVERDGNAADAVHRAFSVGGVGAVSELPGVFSALIATRRPAALHVVTSVPGCRSLHYQIEKDALHLSPLDLGLVAIGERNIDFDRRATATIVACGWPLAGACALQGVKECQPYEHLTWSPRGTSVRRFNPLLSSATRIDARDQVSVARKRDEIIEELRSGAQHQLRYAGNEKAMIALTAGVDSRAGLALMMSLVGRDNIETFTTGGLATQDVRVAQQLARRLGVPHRVHPDAESTVDRFSIHARYLAAVVNGASNCEPAVGFSLTAPEAPRHGGTGGEVFRGYYYNYLRRQVRPVPGAEGVARALLGSPLRRLRACQFADSGLNEVPQQALVAALEPLEDMSSDPHDLADLFYIIERMGRWGSWSWRRSLAPSFVPFANSRAMRALFQLPSPVGDYAVLATAIRKYSPPSVYWTPVNGAELLALEGPGALRYVSRELLRGGAKVTRQLRQRYLPRERSLNQVRSQLFGGELYAFLHDTLCGSRTLARELLGAQQLEQRLARQRGAFDQMGVLGMLLSLELWYEQLQAVARQRDADAAA